MRKNHDEDWKEIGDPTPVEVPLRFRHHSPGMVELIKKHIATAMSREAAAMEKETFEDANDFEVDDDEFLPASRYGFSEQQEAFLNAKLKEVDKAMKEEEDGGTVNSDRDNGDDHGRGGSERKGKRVQRGRVEDVDDGAYDAREERAASGGERRSAGKRRGGVSKGSERDRFVDEEN